MSGAADFFRRLQRSIPRLQAEILEQVILVEAENFHAENFRREGFTDQTFQPWPRRKVEPDPRRGLLVKTGALKGHALKGRKMPSSIDFVMPLPYARRHNEGLDGMPKRQYLGPSAELVRRINRKAKTVLDNRLNSI